MKFTVTRSFSKKIQLKQFEPIDSFCAAQIEFDTEEIDYKDQSVTNFVQIMKQHSLDLDTFCRAEVEMTLVKIRGTKEQGKSLGERKEDAMESAQHDAGGTAPRGKWRPV
jgi:hypothetical protein